jgi:hypothetical protein
MKKLVFLLAALTFSAAHAQVVQTQFGAPALEVQRLAPQLLAFAGSEVNFQNLVNGLNLGLPVTLTTPIGQGVTQVVTFTPSGTMSSTQIAQVLESARQTAISNGLVTPTAQQLATILNGGALATATGNRVVTGLVGTNNTVNATFATTPSVAVQLQNSARFNVSDNPTPRGVSDTPTTPVATTTPTTTTSGAAAGANAPLPAFIPGGAAAGGTANTAPRRWGVAR